jgi:hypothetical protein
VAIRTVVRLVDWLPLLYLVGFLTLLATGARRQRLGDLAARTGIARAAPIRHRGAVGAVVASTLVLVLAGSVVYVATSDEDEGAKIAASDGGGGAQTYRGHGVSFDYPVAWQEATSTSEGGSGADELWRATVAAGRLDFVVVSGYRLKRPVTAENLDAFTSEIEGLVRGAVGQAGETVLAGPEEITVAGLPGAWFRVTGTRDGTPLESRLVFVVDGTAEYEVRCQHTAEKADEIEGGCEQILRTFKVD